MALPVGRLRLHGLIDWTSRCVNALSRVAAVISVSRFELCYAPSQVAKHDSFSSLLPLGPLLVVGGTHLNRLVSARVRSVKLLREVVSRAVSLSLSSFLLLSIFLPSSCFSYQLSGAKKWLLFGPKDQQECYKAQRAQMILLLEFF